MSQQLWFAGVGSRDTPPDILALMSDLSYWLGRCGWGLSSGGAAGADDAFLQGMLKCPDCEPSRRLRIYLIGRKFESYRPDPIRGFHHSPSYTETWEQAKTIAEEVRGSFHGLGDAGIELHTRNVYQVLGHTLKDPVKQTVCWAELVGKQGRVKGGTNTAVGVSLKYDIPVMNLYLDADRQRAERFITAMQERFADTFPYG